MDDNLRQNEKSQIIDIVGRYLLFFALLFFSIVAINIQTKAVDISGLSSFQNATPKIARLIEVFRNAMGLIQPAQALSAIFIAWLYYRNIIKNDGGFSLTALITGGILSSCLLVCRSFSEYGDFSFIIQSNYQIIVAITVLLGYWGIFYVGINEIIKWLDRFKLQEHRLSKITDWIDKHFFVICLIVILLCWLPYLIVYFPGSVPHDTLSQLNQFYGISSLSNHHPVTGTLIMGSIVRLGDLISSTEFGVALCMIFQSIVCALVFADICSYLRKKKMPLLFSLGCVLFYALVPVWGAYAQSVIKDTLFYSMFAWFILEYVKSFLGDGGKYGFIRLSISASMVCLLRNEGFFIALLAVLVLLLLLKNSRKKIGIVLMVVLVCGFGINYLLIGALGISSDSSSESMSIPFSQIARYVRDYGDELTEEDVEVIDAILDYEHLAENYVPELSDKVKRTYRKDATNEDWSAFWKLWAEKFIEHPKVFAEAAINQAYGYFDPFYFYDGRRAYQFYIKGRVTSNEKEPVYASYIFPSEVRDALEQYVNLWQEIPILSFFVNCGAYTWIGILLLALVLRKKNWRDAVIFLIPALNILICCLSPVNGLLRYMLPVMACMPLYLFLGLRSYLFPGIKEEEQEE